MNAKQRRKDRRRRDRLVDLALAFIEAYLDGVESGEVSTKQARASLKTVRELLKEEW